MNFNVEPYLVALMLISGLLAMLDLAYFSKKRKQRYQAALKEWVVFESVPQKTWRQTLLLFLMGRLEHEPKPIGMSDGVSHLALRKYKKIFQPNIIIEYARSLFPVFLLVVFIRSFLFEPYIVPTGSLLPTVLPGDFLLVNKYVYGLRIPLTHYTFYHNSTPSRGDIVVFRYPPNPSISYVKRVIGVPGDTISYINKVLYINGVEMKQFAANAHTLSEESEPMAEWREELGSVSHHILIEKSKASYDFKNLTVPQGYYFMMGDNRDNSLDSRFWGFVPEENLVGRATFIWLSKTPGEWQIRWSRIGRTLKG